MAFTVWLVRRQQSELVRLSVRLYIISSVTDQFYKGTTMNSSAVQFNKIPDQDKSINEEELLLLLFLAVDSLPPWSCATTGQRRQASTP
jgi:hypothetical protein